LNGTWLLLRSGIALSVIVLLYLSQRFWYRGLWRVTSNWGRVWFRVGVRLLYFVGLVLIILSLADNLRQDHGRILPNHTPIALFAGLWFVSAFAAYLAVKAVHGIEWLWHRLRMPHPRQGTSLSPAPQESKTSYPILPAEPFSGLPAWWPAQRRSLA